MTTNAPQATHHAAATGADQSAGLEVFTFGEPEPISRLRLLDYVEAMFNGRWYEPPFPLEGLAGAFRASPHHGSAIYLKRNILTAAFIPHPLLSRETFKAWALDFLVFGNGYLEGRRAVTGRTMRFEHALSRYTRRGKDKRYFYVPNWNEEHEFPAHSVFHLREPDINQELYGLPEYLSALQSALLNESATMFRRRYYENGSHAGFIMYLTDGAIGNADVETLREQLRRAKGPGNFRNLFVHAPNGKPEGLKLIPVSEVAAKDDFGAIKSASMADVLAAHRVPPGLLGIIPNNTGGFGNAKEALGVFMENEIAPLQTLFETLNDWAGDEVVRFEPYQPGGQGAS
ncbi:phage portal protein [Comamonas antarctica]|uniref:Phage portal protein n=1 Tax=Comamonas antarctica TaxID=2743470 RepID=A0A6N1X075_9BURK|nr:phage portal protein [Comamonas antarctica]QKV52657.1 phage portal protein [Comamonas antarctica]